MQRLTGWMDNHTHGALVRGDGYTKLAKYEDTGLEPEEVMALVEERKALKYKLGDVLYIPMPDVTKVIPAVRKIVGISLEESMTVLKLKNTRTGEVSYINAANIGRIVFFTKEEAMKHMDNVEHEY